MMLFYHKTSCNSAGRACSEVEQMPRMGFIGTFLLQALVVNASNAGLLGGSTNLDIAKRYPTLVSPAGWAFAIWSIIYLWELASCAYLYFSTQPTSSLGFASNLFVCANLAQTLWSISFTYEQLGLSCIFLFVIVACLIGAVEEMRGCSSTERLFVALPMSLHAGWTTVAALLNVNLVLVQRMAMAATQLATAFATVYAACFAGILALTLRGNKLYVTAIAWALVAIYFELPANKAMPELDPIARHALRMSSIAIAGLLIHLSLSAVLFEYFFEQLE